MTMLNKFFDITIAKAKNTNLDIPVAAIIVKDNEIISLEVNEKEKENQTTAHAEILAIQKANKKLNSWRLDDCEMFVTLEPCPMCAWAILNSRIKTLYFGSYDLKYGAIESVLKLPKLANSKIKIFGGIYQEECDKILKEYFSSIR